MTSSVSAIVLRFHCCLPVVNLEPPSDPEPQEDEDVAEEGQEGAGDAVETPQLQGGHPCR